MSDQKVLIKFQDREVEWEVSDLVAISLLQNMVALFGPGKEVELEPEPEAKSGEWTDIWSYHKISEAYFFTHEFYLECVIDGRFYFGRYNIDRALLVEHEDTFKHVMHELIREIHNEWVRRTMQGMVI